MATGEQVAGHVDGAVLTEQERDGSSVPVRNILETAKLYELTEKHGLKSSLGGRGRQLSC
jgi:ABC-type transport system involved in cytochrome bd biosynthesis fused ATPase/permease subunit